MSKNLVVIYSTKICGQEFGFAHHIFFPFALKTVKSRVLDIKDIVARALIYSTLYHYMGLILNQ